MNERHSKYRALLKVYSQKDISFNPIYAHITGSVTAGLLLSQIVYLWGSIDTDEFWHTDKQFYNEICLKPDAINRARNKLKKLQLITAVRKGNPAKLYYTLEDIRLIDLIEKFSVTWKPGNKLLGNRVTSYGETTELLYNEEENKKRISLKNNMSSEKTSDDFSKPQSESLKPIPRKNITKNKVTVHGPCSVFGPNFDMGLFVG